MQSTTSGPVHQPVIFTQVKWTPLCVLHAKKHVSPWQPKHDEWRIIALPAADTDILDHNETHGEKQPFAPASLLGDGAAFRMNSWFVEEHIIVFQEDDY